MPACGDVRGVRPRLSLWVGPPHPTRQDHEGLLPPSPQDSARLEPREHPCGTAPRAQVPARGQMLTSLDLSFPIREVQA